MKCNQSRLGFELESPCSFPYDDNDYTTGTSLKAVYGQTHRVQNPLHSADGQRLFTDKVSILNRWSEHFQSFFSADRVVQDPAVLCIPLQLFKAELDELPSVKEIGKVIEQLRRAKAAGVDGIPLELRKERGPALHSTLHELLVCCWEQGRLPSDLHDAVIVILYKNKGEKPDCSNYRGITLLSIAGKILARELLNRLVPTIAEDHLPETQCGFRANRGTTDMVFILRQLREQRSVCSICGPGQSIWYSEQKGTVDDHGAPCLPSKFLSMVIQLHKDQCGQYRLNSDLSGFFPIVNGVMFCHRLCSVSFSVWCLNRTLTITVLYTSAIVLTAVCLPSQKHFNSCSVTYFSLTSPPSLPTPKEPCNSKLPALQRLSNTSDMRSTWRRLVSIFLFFK